MSHERRRGRVRPVSSYDVAREAGVARSTVSLVLNNAPGLTVSQATIERVKRAAERLGYRPNVAARSVAGGKAYAVGLISRWEPDSPLFARPVKGILARTRAAGYGLTLCDLGFDSITESLKSALDSYREGRIDGLIALMKTRAGEVERPEVLAELREPGMPVVLVNADTQDPAIDDIVSDNVHAGYLGTSHLAGLGHRRIALLSARAGAERGNYAAAARFEGYKAALAAHGLPFDPALVVHVEAGPTSTPSAFRAFGAYLRSVAPADRPTAVYAISDHLAAGALQAAQDLGLAVPRELAVVGTDDLDVARHTRPQLTSVRQPLERMGEEAASLLLRRIAGEAAGGPVKVRLPCTLTVRESCGAGAAMPRR